MTKKKAEGPELFETEKATEKPSPKPAAEKKKKTEIAVMEAPRRPVPTTIYETLLLAAQDPKVDVEKMRAIVELQIQFEAAQREKEKDEAKKAFTRAFNALQSELPVINKDGLIDHGEGTTARGNKKLKARFATYPNIMRVCGPLLKKHGFTLSNVIEPSDDGARIIVVGYLEHVEGHSRTSRFPLGIDSTGGKNNQQGWGSSQQYGMRYNAIALLNIVSEAKEDRDNDGYQKKDAPSDECLTEAEVEELKIAMADAGVAEPDFCSRYKIGSIAELPEKFFNEAKKALKDYKARKAGKDGANA